MSCRRQRAPSSRAEALRLLHVIVVACCVANAPPRAAAEIASASASVTATATTTAVAGPLANNVDSGRCAMPRFLANAIDDVEDLELDVPANIAFEHRQKKRFLLYLNASTPLTITFSQSVVRKIYYNQTTNLLRSRRAPDQRSSVLLPCALPGQYDLFVQARRRGSIKLEAHAAHPQSGWPLLNATSAGSGSGGGVAIRHQNRVRKRQMVVKWEKSKFDVHAVHYCLVVSASRAHRNFCGAVEEFVESLAARKRTACFPGPVMDYVWQRPPEKARKIDARITNIVCTGSRTQQLLRGVAPNRTYHLDVFGVHTHRQNLTFHIASARVQFNRTHPHALRANTLTVERLAGLQGVQVFSYKIPVVGAQHLRYLVLPCGGSEIDAKILKQRKTIGSVANIYRPTYIKCPAVLAGERYIIRFAPTNDDEKLRANKVALAVTTTRLFRHLPELPENITVFEVRTDCTMATIAWYSSPDVRSMSYCIIVFNLPQRNRSTVDYTNYCMDFGANVAQHRHFYTSQCSEKVKSAPPLEKHTIFNLTPGASYLIYVTANLSEGKALPYQSLKVRTRHECIIDSDASSQEQTYFDDDGGQ